MSTGIIYLMTTAVPGLVKIGKTSTSNFKQRMYHLENNGYRNVTSLKREFAIEVEEYDEKELLLQTIFEKSRVADTELFAVDVNIVKQLLSSFEGNKVYPESESKIQIFKSAVESASSNIIPDGNYYFERKKRSDNKIVKGTAKVINGNWTLLKGAVIGKNEDAGVSQKVRECRNNLLISKSGTLAENFSLGKCSPSFAGSVLMNQSCDGWNEWKNSNGETIDIYRQNRINDD